MLPFTGRMNSISGETEFISLKINLDLAHNEGISLGYLST